mgnify:CR=1 FL=1
MKVENKNAHRAADKHYFFATHVLTDKELERAAKRAEKNKEDLPKHFAIIQGKNEEETTLLDDTDVAEPKKSTGFFGWLMGD